MKLFSAFPAAVLAFALASANAQTPAAAPAAAHNPKPYRVTYTLTEMDGTKTIGVQHYTLIVVEGGRSTIKNGSKIPVATGSYAGGGGGNGSVQTQFTYLDIGINLDTTLVDEVDGMWRLKAKVEESSVAEKPATIAGVEEPIVRQSVLEMSTSVTLGKPQVLGTLDFTGTTRRLDIEVMLEPVK
jgi:type II secretory pathway component GspD/PulD (secretin)